MKTTNIKNYKTLAALMTLTFLFGCSEDKQQVRSSSELNDPTSERVAAAFFKYQHNRTLGEIQQGRIMCVKDLVGAGYLEKEDLRNSDEVVKMGENRTVEIYKGGCKKLLSAKP